MENVENENDSQSHKGWNVKLLRSGSEGEESWTNGEVIKIEMEQRSMETEYGIWK